ncbi:MAG: phosphopantothenoylcysteine decarboxylase [Puniceicoccales bacterium]|jgi:phosphopantothenoylcysteine decarboxylase/phosphopantothenate--cysteine ligase|nr:phosphopantothenoylcysteine decarboxylase [Puniceicoccales bacterium]
MPVRCLITAGPTREFFDPVRFVSNPSSGKMGYALAAAAATLGCEVELVSGPVALPAPPGVRLYRVITGAEMLECVGTLFDTCDVLVKAAAVCDFRPCAYSAQKVKKEAVPCSVEFEPVPDILKMMAARRRPDQVLVGFAAETVNVEAYARRKLQEKRLDWIVANRVGREGGADLPNAFEADTNTVLLLSAQGLREEYGPAPKPDVARWLLQTMKIPG